MVEFFPFDSGLGHKFLSLKQKWIMKKNYLVSVVKDGKVLAAQKFYCTKEWLDNFVCKIFKCFPNVHVIHVKEI